MKIDISIVVPLLNEAESLPELYQWIKRATASMGKVIEIWFVDDGSTDDSWKVIENLQQKDNLVHGIKFRRNYGKSAALNIGFEQCAGEVVITMDADLQDSPEEIPELYRMIKEEGFDLVSGWKKKRYDPLSKTIPTKIYNGVTGWLTGVKLHDMNCGLKSYNSEVVKSIEVYGEMHRYIPVIAKWAGFYKVGEKVVQHQSRKYGVTKFGLSRFLYGFLDLFSIMFIGKFGRRPMHFFGAIGTMMFGIGGVILLYLASMKVFFDEKNIADRPLFYLAFLLVIVGTQLFIGGFLAELISRNSPERNNYKIAKIL